MFSRTCAKNAKGWRKCGVEQTLRESSDRNMKNKVGPNRIILKIQKCAMKLQQGDYDQDRWHV